MAVGPKCMQTAAKPGQKQSKCFKRRPQVPHWYTVPHHGMDKVEIYGKLQTGNRVERGDPGEGRPRKCLSALAVPPPQPFACERNS